jgi:membrane protease YdiL (CAAX protease family)
MGGLGEIPWGRLGPWDWLFLALSVGMIGAGLFRLARGDATPSPRVEPGPRAALPASLMAPLSVLLFLGLFGLLTQHTPFLVRLAGGILALAGQSQPAAVGGVLQSQMILAGFLGQLLTAAILLGLARAEPALLRVAPDGSDAERLSPGAASAWRLAGLLAAGFALMWIAGLFWLGFASFAEAQGLDLPKDNQVMVDLILRHDGPAWPLVVLGLFVIVGAPLVEEIGFRGMIYPAWREILPRGWAVAFTGFLFAIIHGNLATLLPIAMLGAWLCLVRDRFGLWPCVLLHMGVNAWTFCWLLRAPEVARHL